MKHPIKSLRILYLTPGFYQVGDFFRYMGFAKSLARLGHKVTVLSSRNEKQLTSVRISKNGVEVVLAPYWGGLEMMGRLSPFLAETKMPLDITYKAAFSILNARHFDIVHGFHIGFNVFIPFKIAAILSKRSGMIYDWCDLWDGGILSPPNSGMFRRFDYRITVALERLSYRNADGITVNTSFLFERAAKYGVAHENIALIREGADVDIVESLEMQKAREGLRIESNIFLIGFAGFFNPDARLLVEVLSFLKTEGTHNIRLLFIGPITSLFNDLIDQYSIKDMIIPTGTVAHESVGAYLSACDVLLLPFSDSSLNRARWPIKLNDYLAVGRAVIAGRTGDIEDFFRKYPQIGILCDGKPEDYGNAVLALAGDSDRRKQCAKAARNVAISALDWRDSAKQMETFYFRTLEKKRNTSHQAI